MQLNYLGLSLSIISLFGEVHTDVFTGAVQGGAHPLYQLSWQRGMQGGGRQFHYQIHFFNVERQYPVTITTIMPPLLLLQMIMNQ
jgi:hypothetical protein